MGVFAQTVAGPRVLSAVHKVDESGERGVQAGRLESGVQAMGNAQEQARYELRDDGASPQVLLPARHTGEGRWAKIGLSVRGGAERYRRNRLLRNVNSL